VGALVEDFRDRLEGFLSSRVPNLQLHVDVLHAYEQRPELHSDGDFVVLSELIVAHAVH